MSLLMKSEEKEEVKRLRAVWRFSHLLLCVFIITGQKALFDLETAALKNVPEFFFLFFLWWLSTAEVIRENF